MLTFSSGISGGVEEARQQFADPSADEKSRRASLKTAPFLSWVRSLLLTVACLCEPPIIRHYHA